MPQGRTAGILTTRFRVMVVEEKVVQVRFPVETVLVAILDRGPADHLGRHDLVLGVQGAQDRRLAEARGLADVGGLAGARLAEARILPAEDRSLRPERRRVASPTLVAARGRTVAVVVAMVRGAEATVVAVVVLVVAAVAGVAVAVVITARRATAVIAARRAVVVVAALVLRVVRRDPAIALTVTARRGVLAWERRPTRRARTGTLRTQVWDLGRDGRVVERTIAARRTVECRGISTGRARRARLCMMCAPKDRLGQLRSLFSDVSSSKAAGRRRRQHSLAAVETVQTHRVRSRRATVVRPYATLTGFQVEAGVDALALPRRFHGLSGCGRRSRHAEAIDVAGTRAQLEAKVVVASEDLGRIARKLIVEKRKSALTRDRASCAASPAYRGREVLFGVGAGRPRRRATVIKVGNASCDRFHAVKDEVAVTRANKHVSRRFEQADQFLSLSDDVLLSELVDQPSVGDGIEPVKQSLGNRLQER